MLEKRRDFWMRDATGAEAKRFACGKRKRIGEISRCFSDSKSDDGAAKERFVGMERETSASAVFDVFSVFFWIGR